MPPDQTRREYVTCTDALMPRAHGCAGAVTCTDALMPRAHGCAGAAHVGSVAASMLLTVWSGGIPPPASRVRHIYALLFGRVFIAILLISLLSTVLVTTARADIWKRIDSHGILHLSDRYMGPGSVLILRSRKKVSSRQRRPSAQQYDALRKRYTPLINSTAQRYRMDKHLIHAVVQAESDYNPRAVSNKGAVGLMQLMPATARRYGVTDRRDPAQNLSGGIRYLRDLMRQFRSVALALAAYNAGEGAVKKYSNKIPPYPETKNYIRKVIRIYKQRRKAS